jgi:hypothetical protein
MNLFARVAGIGAALAVVAGILSNSKTIYRFVCEATGSCSAPTYRLVDEAYSTYQEAAQLQDKLRSFAGKVVYLDIEVQNPAFEPEASTVEADSNPEEEDCATFFTSPPAPIRQDMEYCVSKSKFGTFGPRNTSVFTWKGYYFIEPSEHVGQGFNQTRAKPLAPEVAIPLLKQQ